MEGRLTKLGKGRNPTYLIYGFWAAQPMLTSHTTNEQNLILRPLSVVLSGTVKRKKHSDYGIPLKKLN